MNCKSFLLAALLLFSACTANSQSVFKNNDLEITKLGAKLWVVETTDKTTMYIVEGSKKAMLIDTGTKCEKLNEVVRKITQKPLVVVITHMHGDHAGNMDQFDEVYLHPADTVLLKQVKPYHGKIHFVKDGEILDLGGKKLEICHMPAPYPRLHRRPGQGR